MLSWDGKFWGSQKQPQTTTDVQPSIRPQRPSANPTRERIQLPEEKLEVEQFNRAKQDALRDVNLRTTNQGTFEELKKLFIELQNGPNTNGISGQINQVPTLTGFLDKYRDVSGMRINENEQQDVNLFLTSLFDHLEIHLDCLEMHNFVRRYFRCFLSEQQICVNGHIANNAQRQKIITIQMSGVSSLYASLGRLNRGQFAQGSNCSECQEKGLGNNALIKRKLLQTLPNTIIFNIARVDFDIKQQKAVKDKSRFTFPFGFNQKQRDGQRGKQQNEEDQLDDILDLTPFTREAVLKNEATVKDNQERYQLIKKKINGYKTDEQKDNDIRNYPIKAASYDNLGRGEQYYKFRLVGVVVHSGNATGGHYYSYVRERSPPYRWIKFNDERTQYIAFRDEIKKQKSSSSSSSSQQSNVQELIPSFDNQYQMMEEECFGGSRPTESLNPDLRANLKMQHSAGRELMKEMLKRDSTACMIIYERIHPIDDWAFELGLIPQNIQQQQTPQNKYPRNQQGVFNFSSMTEINSQPDPVIVRAQQLKTVNQVQVLPKPTTQVPPQTQIQSSTNTPPNPNLNQQYAYHLLGKLDKGELLKQIHINWIFNLFPNKMVEYNQKNQIDKPIFLRVLLNTIIQQAEVSPPTIPVQQQLVSFQSNPHQQNPPQTLLVPSNQPQSQQVPPQPPSQKNSQFQQQPKTYIKSPPPPNTIPNPNINPQQQQQGMLPIPATFQVNINFGIQNVAEVKDYANYLLVKQNRGEQFTDQDITWIFQFCPDKIVEYNQKSPIDNPDFNTSWKISDFKKIKKIGKGRFGTVYSMQEIRTQNIVAIKECDYDTDEEKEMVNKEVAVMRDIYQIISQSAQQSSFLHIVQPLGFFLNEDKAYLVMEYCAGGDLRKYINDLRKMEAEVSQKKCYEIVGQLASSIYQLHMNDIIHGDMKPDNVLLTEDLKVKLADFGLTRKLREGKEYMTFLGGTTVYQAPEVLQSQTVQQIPTGREKEKPQRRTQTIAVDIWAIGIMLFELLAQHHPFIGKDEDAANLSEMEIGNRIVNLQPTELPSHYPVGLRNLIMAMLSKDPSRRITAEEILEEPEVAASLKK
ncbi:MAG: putative NEK protein kinase [Streblomastix strix]|uniref:Putative NEK protein kinase n=1 Tax=Streblomastix strix TaxID=222440 RepID=A0A5J4WRP2_9EUKA|nr:MAG: putative NEK protein kinase [Streblomastix strix]